MGSVNSIHPLLCNEALKKEIHVNLNLADSLPLMVLDEKEMKQLMLNFCANAMDAMENGGELTISTQRQGETVSLSIADTGCGIPEDKLPKIFDPFYTTKASGTGLGLAVSLRIIERHNASISCRFEGRARHYLYHLV